MGHFESKTYYFSVVHVRGTRQTFDELNKTTYWVELYDHDIIYESAFFAEDFCPCGRLLDSGSLHEISESFH